MEFFLIAQTLRHVIGDTDGLETEAIIEKLFKNAVDAVLLRLSLSEGNSYLIGKYISIKQVENK